MIPPDSVSLGEWYVDALTSVKITVTDAEHILRAVNNHTDAGVPAGPGEKGFQDFYYGPMTVEEVMQHLAYNAIANGIEDASRLDGWADLPPDVLTMSVEEVVEWERVLAPEPGE